MKYLNKLTIYINYLLDKPSFILGNLNKCIFGELLLLLLLLLSVMNNFEFPLLIYF